MGSRDGSDELGKIFVGGVARDVDEGILTSYFSQFGNVVLASVMRDKFGISRGFGFVAFDPPSIAGDVLQKIHVIEGRTIEIKQAVKHDRVYSRQGPVGSTPLPSNGVVLPGASPVPADRDGAIFVPRQVYVGGLPYNVTEAEVREYFNQFGPVVSANLKYDFGQNPPKFRGFGFVNFVEDESVERALENYSSHQLGGKWIEVKRSKHSHVVQGENSGTIMPQMVQGSGSGKGGAYDGGKASAFKDPYGGVARRDPYGGVASSGPVRGPYNRGRGGDYETSSGSGGGRYGSSAPSYRSSPYGQSGSGYEPMSHQAPPMYHHGSSNYPSQQRPPARYEHTAASGNEYQSSQPAVATFDPYMTAPNSRPSAYQPKSGGWRSQPSGNPPM